MKLRRTKTVPFFGPPCMHWCITTTTTAAAAVAAFLPHQWHVNRWQMGQSTGVTKWKKCTPDKILATLMASVPAELLCRRIQEGTKWSKIKELSDSNRPRLVVDDDDDDDDVVVDIPTTASSRAHCVVSARSCRSAASKNSPTTSSCRVCPS